MKWDVPGVRMWPSGQRHCFVCHTQPSACRQAWSKQSRQGVSGWVMQGSGHEAGALPEPCPAQSCFRQTPHCSASGRTMWLALLLWPLFPHLCRNTATGRVTCRAVSSSHFLSSVCLVERGWRPGAPHNVSEHKTFIPQAPQVAGSVPAPPLSQGWAVPWTCPNK